MPELPEVETVRRGLSRQLTDFSIRRVEVLRARAVAWPPEVPAFRAGLEGSRTGVWQRRGKYLICPLHSTGSGPVSTADNGEADRGLWVVHLRMTGQFLWHTPPLPDPCPHTRVRLWDAGGDELRFVDTRSFGQMWWVPPDLPVEAIVRGLQEMGPEPLGDAFTLAGFREALKGSRRPVKTALLDQRVVAGIGNIYADESLFMAGLHPLLPAGTLDDAALERLRQALIEVLQLSIGAGGTTFRDFRDLRGLNGNYGGQAWVYGRTGEPCRRCGTVIERLRISGRSSHWCPRCQAVRQAPA
ncbi:DNA-formamidopyrimidine glycosylase [Synechococcus sp. RSCCF101]|uniref:DNA-formamidopyrimidine glycosylase n=1 Tax=Synechococcus sp. RSCCF101 TaxID=2511069 RepID=UPI00124401D3|nr:DNA-formamidopyrimidine glycosylase [Synechococcus sp. RSCCF101]QEY32099.1 DNA-formamidopyrimidine glycosylase [Synechococcus sp. RSCCF101]